MLHESAGTSPSSITEPARDRASAYRNKGRSCCRIFSTANAAIVMGPRVPAAGTCVPGSMWSSLIQTGRRSISQTQPPSRWMRTRTSSKTRGLLAGIEESRATPERTASIGAFPMARSHRGVRTAWRPRTPTNPRDGREPAVRKAWSVPHDSIWSTKGGSQSRPRREVGVGRWSRDDDRSGVDWGL